MQIMPTAVYLIILAEFCGRSAFCGLRSLLSLYLRNVLLLDENLSTVVYHGFIMTCFTVPFLGAILADGSFGRFTTIIVFSIVTCAGHAFVLAAALPPLGIDVMWYTMIGLGLLAVGAGGVKPCIAAFGGEQFRLPQQQDDLSTFFPVFYFTANLGGLFGTLVTPFLRNTVSCFGAESCYALGFGLPAGLALLALVVFLVGSPFYRKEAPNKDENILGLFFSCVTSAIANKIRSKKGDGRKHWLDYAGEKYDKKLVRDIKAVLSILVIIVPLPVFWSLIVQQGSRWTFQATRMDGEILDMEVLPDHIQALGPAIVLLLIPIFNKMIYPIFAKCHLLISPLSKMSLGGVAASLAFICAAGVEFKLQHTYSPQLTSNQAHVIMINTLPCQLHVIHPHKDHYWLLPPGQIVSIPEITVENETQLEFKIKCEGECVWGCFRHLQLIVKPQETKTVLIGSSGQQLEYFPLATEDLAKPLSGSPKLRSDTSLPLDPAGVSIYDDTGRMHFYFVGLEPMALSNYTDLPPGNYTYYITYNAKGREEYRGGMLLRAGGVYSLVLRESQHEIVFAESMTLVPPNQVHMVWLLPQYFLISIAEVLFAIPGMEFCFSQAPRSMLTVTMAAWYFTVACGNMLVIIITQIHTAASQVDEFLRFSFLLLLDVVLFRWLSGHYRAERAAPQGSSPTDSSKSGLVLMPSHLSIHS